MRNVVANPSSKDTRPQHVTSLIHARRPSPARVKGHAGGSRTNPSRPARGRPGWPGWRRCCRSRPSGPAATARPGWGPAPARPAARPRRPRPGPSAACRGLDDQDGTAAAQDQVIRRRADEPRRPPFQQGDVERRARAVEVGRVEGRHQDRLRLGRAGRRPGGPALRRPRPRRTARPRAPRRSSPGAARPAARPARARGPGRARGGPRGRARPSRGSGRRTVEQRRDPGQGGGLGVRRDRGQERPSPLGAVRGRAARASGEAAPASGDATAGRPRPRPGPRRPPAAPGRSGSNRSLVTSPRRSRRRAGPAASGTAPGRAPAPGRSRRRRRDVPGDRGPGPRPREGSGDLLASGPAAGEVARDEGDAGFAPASARLGPPEPAAGRDGLVEPGRPVVADPPGEEFRLPEVGRGGEPLQLLEDQAHGRAPLQARVDGWRC